MLLKLMVSKGSYKSKEASINHIAAIKSNKSSNCSIKEVTIKELGEYLLAGHMIVPSILEEDKPLRDEFFKGTQIFGLDFDNEEVCIVNDKKIKVRARDDLYLTADTILNTCKAYGINLFMIYETYSSTDEWKRYRVLFAIKNIITDITYRKEVLEALITIFSVDGISTVDTACTDPSRVFFGAKEIVYEDESYFDELKAIEVASNIKNDKKQSKKALNASNIKGSGGVGFSVDTYLNISSYVSTKNLELIEAGNHAGLRAILKPDYKEFSSYEECIYHITHEINLSEFIGVQHHNSFSCIFHNDSSPSGGITRLEDGQYFYKCFASSCGFKGNIITLTAKILCCTRIKAIRFIQEVYDLHIIEPEWARDYKDELRENIRMIADSEIREIFPVLDSIVSRYYMDLILIHEFAIQNRLLKDLEDNIIFYVSQNKLASILNSRQSSVCMRLALFALLKLIYKIDDANIPEDLFKRSQEESKENRKKDTIHYYFIPSYTWDNLAMANERAKQYKEKHCTMKGVSREMIYRSFGEDIANEIYPKRKDVKPADASERFKERFEKWLLKLIAKNGYATEKIVLEKLNGYKTLNEIISKRILGQVLEECNLQRIRANKELKHKYNIKSKGYPYVIVDK